MPRRPARNFSSICCPTRGAAFSTALGRTANLAARRTLTFDAPIKFDLADVVVALPRAIGGIDAELRDDTALVRFSFLAKVDVRTFRDDGGYVLDIVGADNKPDEQGAAPAAPGAPTAPQQSAAPETTTPATVPPAAA